jgi:tRNA threonylcarbamoyladenosine biosynthesis protein TsaB
LKNPALSYTGLRIGISTAKGLAFALNIPLIATDTLYCMASGFLEKHPDLTISQGHLLCPMIDARRMEVYSAIYNLQLKELRQINAEIIHKDSFMSLLKNNRIHFFGDGAIKCRDIFQTISAFFYEGFYPSASFMGKIAFSHFNNRQFENLAYFEPLYLKDFVATIPVNKLNKTVL